MAFSAIIKMLPRKRKTIIYFSLVLATVFVTAALYNPAALIIYKISEPYFKCPIAIESRGLVIRNDARGNGEFGAKRRNGRSH